MRKLIALALLATVAAAPVMAAQTASEKAADIAADQKALAKDNAAIAKQDANMAHNRVEKAHAKATDNVGKQAQESVELGANHVAKGYKKVERSVDSAIADENAK